MQGETLRTGTDLKVERVKARVPAIAVARAMGISSSRLSRIEGPARVTDRMRERFIAALETCRTSGTSEVA